MNKLFSFFLFFLYTMVSSAQKSSFGIVNYTVPASYEFITNDNVLTYYKEDKSTGAYCNFFIYKLMPGKGDAAQNFGWAWENLVQKPFKFSSTANQQPEAVIKGWQFIIGTAKFLDKDISTLAVQICFTGENNMQGICVLSNSDNYKKDIEDFIASVDVVRETGGAAANTPSTKLPDVGSAGVSSSTQQQTLANSLNDKSPKPEVWMKSKFEYDMMKQMSLTKYEWIAIYPDGKFCPYMYGEGYAGVYNTRKDWGSAKWNGNRLNIVEGTNAYYYDKKSATTMQRNSDGNPYYYKCKPVDGLRIEGAYTQYASLIPSEKNEAQFLIWFYKDGSFDDRGMWVINLSNPYALPDCAPGKGKYSIGNFSIILQYADGRKKQMGFSGFLDKDPATVTDAYFIGRNLYYRKDKGYNNNLNKINDR